MAGSKITAASDLSFHQKIKDKYRKTKNNYTNFPNMIFMKNLGYLLKNNINLGFFFRLCLKVRNMFFSSRQGEKIVRNFVDSNNNILRQYNTSLKSPIVSNEINLLLNIAKFIQTAYAFNSFQKVMSDNRNFSGFRYISDNRGFSFSNNEHYSFMNKGISQTISLWIKENEFGNNFDVFSSQIEPIWVHNTFSRNNWQQLNYSRILKTIDIRVQKNVLNDNHFLSNTKQPHKISISKLFQTSNTSKNDLSCSNILVHSVFWGSKEVFQNHINVSKMFEIKYPAFYQKNNSLLNNRTLLYGNENSFKEIKQNNIFENQYNLFFKTNKNIEQIKKITDELKYAISQKSIPGKENKNDMDIHIDINRISDRVYQMIDQKIKIEKERRGYL